MSGRVGEGTGGAGQLLVAMGFRRKGSHDCFAKPPKDRFRGII